MKSSAVKSVELDIDWAVQTMMPVEFQGREIHLEARAYQGVDPHCQAMVLVHRDNPAPGELPVVRVHSGCVTGDIFHSLRCDCYPQLQASMEVINTSPLGVMVYLPYHEGRGIGLVNKIRTYALQDQGYDTVEANHKLGFAADLRDYTVGARILFDLGVRRLKLMTNNPDKVRSAEEQGLIVTERRQLEVPPRPANRRYMETKQTKFGHLLSMVGEGNDPKGSGSPQ